MGVPRQWVTRALARRHNGVVSGARVLVVEDDDFTRTTLAGALAHAGYEIVGAVGDAGNAVGRVTALLPDCAVLDLDLGPGPTGIDIAHGMRRALPALGIVILTSFSDPRLLSTSLKDLPLGASYVVKQSLTDLGILVAAIDGAIALAGTAAMPDEASGLTDAQVDTLRLLAAGLSNAEIARARFVTEKSVEQAIARAAKRLGVVATTSVNQRVSLARAYFRLIGALHAAR